MEGRDYEKRIKEKGLKKKYIAEMLEITPTTMGHKLSGKSHFTRPERYLLEAILRGEKVD